MTDGLKHDLQVLPAEMTETVEEPERPLWEALRASAALAEGLLRARLGAETGLSVARLEALHELYGLPDGLTMGQLARALGATPANVTALVDGLERDGWVAREAVSGDRRQTRVRLTEGARASFAALRPGVEAALAELFAGLSPTEARLLHGLLAKLQGQLQAEHARQAGTVRERAAPATPKPFGWGWV